MEKIKELLSHFERVHYKCSMELWGPKNDYIRFPSKWDEVERNIRLIDSLPNVDIGFAMTLNPISIGYVDEAMKAGEEFGIMPSYFNVTRPRWFTLKSLPDDVEFVCTCRFRVQCVAAVFRAAGVEKNVQKITKIRF